MNAAGGHGSVLLRKCSIPSFPKAVLVATLARAIRCGGVAPAYCASCPAKNPGTAPESGVADRKHREGLIGLNS